MKGPQGFFSGVGTILFNMIVNPASGKVYVTNTEARNDVRFAGHAVFAETTVQGHFAENRITVRDPQPHAITSTATQTTSRGTWASARRSGSSTKPLSR